MFIYPQGSGWERVRARHSTFLGPNCGCMYLQIRHNGNRMYVAVEGTACIIRGTNTATLHANCLPKSSWFETRSVSRPVYVSRFALPYDAHVIYLPLPTFSPSPLCWPHPPEFFTFVKPVAMIKGSRRDGPSFFSRQANRPIRHHPHHSPTPQLIPFSMQK